MQKVASGFLTRMMSLRRKRFEALAKLPEEVRAERQMQDLTEMVSESATMARSWFIANRVRKRLSAKDKKDKKFMKELRFKEQDAKADFKRSKIIKEMVPK